MLFFCVKDELLLNVRGLSAVCFSSFFFIYTHTNEEEEEEEEEEPKRNNRRVDEAHWANIFFLFFF